jgi:hypothetical protein
MMMPAKIRRIDILFLLLYFAVFASVVFWGFVFWFFLCWPHFHPESAIIAALKSTDQHQRRRLNTRMHTPTLVVH